MELKKIQQHLAITKQEELGCLAVFHPSISAQQYYNFFCEDMGVNKYDVLFPDDALERFEDAENLLSKYITFIEQTWEIWLKKDNPNVRIRAIENAISSLISGEPAEFSHDKHKVLVLDVNGNAFLEDGLRAIVDYEDLKLGNLNNANIDVLIKKAESLLAEHFIPPVECQECKYLKICCGGEFTHRIVGPDRKIRKSPLCLGYMKSFQRAEEFLKECVS